MSHYTVLSPAQIARLQAGHQQMQAYVAFHPLTTFTTTSRDIINVAGQVTVPPPLDLLNSGIAPFTPLPLFGSHRIGFVNEPLYFDGSLSVQRHNILAWGHAWTATGSPTMTTYHTPVAIGTIDEPAGIFLGPQQIACTWSQPGEYQVTLTVEDRYGNHATGIRYVRIYADRQNIPQVMVNLSTISGASSQGGYTCQFTATQVTPDILPPDVIPAGTYLPVTIFIEAQSSADMIHWQDAAMSPYGNFVPGQPYRDPRIMFCGYIKQGSAHYDYQSATLSFTTQTPELILQEANILTTAYYNATWSGQVANASLTSIQWNSQTEILSQSDRLVADLTTTDIYHGLLQGQTNFATYHDVLLSWDWIPDPINPCYVSQPTYTSLTINQGTIWAGIGTLIQNEMSTAYADRSGAIHIEPSINQKQSPSWNWWNNAPKTATIAPQHPVQEPHQGTWPPIPGAEDVNIARNTAFPPWYPLAPYQLGPGNTLLTTTSDVSVNTTPAAIPPYAGPHITYVDAWRIYNLRNEFFSQYVPNPVSGQSPYTVLTNQPPQIVWLPMLHVLWGTRAMPQPCMVDQLYERDPTQARILPITAHYSDQPIIEYGQDSTLRFVICDITEVYVQRPTFVKVIGYTVQTEAAYGGSYPTNTFDQQGAFNGTAATGSFTLIDNLVLPDMTAKSAILMVWIYLWQLARLQYKMGNISYQAQMVVPLQLGIELNDIIMVTRSRSALGPLWSQKLFLVQGVSYTFNWQQMSWQTSLQLIEVITNTTDMATMVVPPYGPPQY